MVPREERFDVGESILRDWEIPYEKRAIPGASHRKGIGLTFPNQAVDSDVATQTKGKTSAEALGRISLLFNSFFPRNWFTQRGGYTSWQSLSRLERSGAPSSSLENSLERILLHSWSYT